MFKRSVVTVAAGALMLAAHAPVSAQLLKTQGQRDWTGQEQVYRAPAGTTTPRPDLSPEQQLGQFFKAVRGGEHEQALAMIARRPLNISENQLSNNLKLWMDQVRNQPSAEFEVLETQQTGDFALARVAFAAGGGDVRPVVLFNEGGRWKVVWELIGLQPSQARDQMPRVAQRLEPLYDWYAQVQRTSVQQAMPVDRGGEPATLSDEARARRRAGGTAQSQAQQAQGQQAQGQQAQGQQAQGQQAQGQQAQGQQQGERQPSG